ncbi:Unknown protein, partial [Striga hermonthica]
IIRGEMVGDVLNKLLACSLSEKEAGGFELRTDDVKASKEECEWSLFGKVVGDIPASIMGVKRTMSSIWRLQKSMEVKEISSNYFQFIFSSMEDKAKVAAGNNWLFENQYLILTEWNDGLHSNHPCFEEINIWVQVMNVPLNWMCTEAGMRIGQIFNKVKNVVVCKVGGEAGSFFKILVALNLKEPIPRCTVVKLGEQSTMVAFRYERLVNLCYYCGRIGHLDRGCLQRDEDIDKGKPREGQFGEWLKVKETYHGGRNYFASSSEAKSAPPQQHSNHDSIVSASVTPMKFSNQQPEAAMESEEKDQGAELEPQNSQALLIVPTAVESCPNLMEMVVEGQQTQVENSEIGLSVLPTLIQNSGDCVQETGGLRKGALWKRKKSSVGRLLRMDEITVCRKLGFGSRWHLGPPRGSRGGLLVLWDVNTEIKQIVANDFCVQMEAKGPGMREWNWLIFVYLSTDRRERASQWEFLEMARLNWGRCWTIAGDWNDIVNNEEKRGGVRRQESSFRGFRSFIHNMGMHEVEQKGAFFTWGNNREGDGYVEERLEKIFTSYDWMVAYPKMEVANFYRTASDHNVLMMDTDMEVGRYKKRFAFDKLWAKVDGVQDAVTPGWQIAVEGSAMYQVHQKIKSTRMALLAWHKPIHRNSEKAVITLTGKLEELIKGGHERNWEEWYDLKAELDRAHQEEEAYWRMKSRAMWLKEGDRNSRFFHAVVAQRRKSNSIQRLVTGEGVICASKESIVHHLEGFYSNLFSSDGSYEEDEILQHIPCSISDELNNNLISPVEEMEVKEAL